MPKARTIAKTTASTAVATSIPHSEKRAAGRSALTRKGTASGTNWPEGVVQDVSLARDIEVSQGAAIIVGPLGPGGPASTSGRPLAGSVAQGPGRPTLLG